MIRGRTMDIHGVIPEIFPDIHRLFQLPSGAPQRESFKMEKRAGALGGCTGPLIRLVSGKGGRSVRLPAGAGQPSESFTNRNSTRERQSALMLHDNAGVVQREQEYELSC